MSNLPILPGSTIGIVGGGQLGRMTALTAIRMGYEVRVLDPDPQCPAASCSKLTVAKYSDPMAMRQFSERCSVVTIEFENLSADALRNAVCPVHPMPEVLEVCQDRAQEKNFLHSNGIAVPPFEIITHLPTPAQLDRIVSDVGFPAVVKTLRMGYDGKGQWKVTDRNSLETAIRKSDGNVIVEKFVEFKRELSIIVARNIQGETKCYPLVENVHTRHILDYTIAPAGAAEHIQAAAEIIGVTVANRLNLVGILCIELFETKDGKLLVNELAPRPHNSGHWSIEGAVTSQYEQLIRAITGLPLGDTSPRFEKVVMGNLLGDHWEVHQPDWSKCFRDSNVYLHLYGKYSARAGRKMGHLTVVGNDALERMMRIRRDLLGRNHA